MNQGFPELGARVVRRYLDRLGVTRERPSIEFLSTLHTAHLERVPYENLDIQRGQPAGIDPVECAERVADLGRAGYCFHQNAAFGALLTSLGFEVSRHYSTVHTEPDEYSSARLNHLALTVRGLPNPVVPDGIWWVDAGLGDGFWEPLPLRVGEYYEGRFTYGLSADVPEPGWWRFRHDPSGACHSVDLRPDPPDADTLAAAHLRLSTDADSSSFVSTCVVQRRDSNGFDTLRGLVLIRTDASGTTSQPMPNQQAWYAALERVFGLTLPDYPAETKAALWERVRAAHERWQARREARREADQQAESDKWGERGIS